MNSGLQGITIPECTEEDGRIRYRGILSVPQSDALSLGLIQEYHYTALAGHPGWVKTFDLVDREFYWNQVPKAVDRYVPNRDGCQQSWSLTHSTFRVLWQLPVPNHLWEDISMDFVGGLPECERFYSGCMVVDGLSKMLHCILCHTTINAAGRAELSLRDVVRPHRPPLTIISEHAPQYVSTFWGQICDRLVIDWMMSTAVHPPTDSQMERMNTGMER